MTDLVLTPNPAFVVQLAADRNLIQELLSDRRSPNTKRSYQRSLIEFFRFITDGSDPTNTSVNAFILLEYKTAFKLAINFKAHLMQKGLSESSVNNRMAAVRSLIKHAQTAGICEWNLDGILSEKVTKYRDTSGITIEEFIRVLQVPDRSTLKGKRDYAMLRIFWEILLRRNEVCTTSLEDFRAEQGLLMVKGKGKGTQKVGMDLSDAAVAAVQDWLKMRSEQVVLLPSAPLFTALDPSAFGKRITGSGLYYLVNSLGKKAGIEHLTPHKIRHSGITALLDANNGNVRAAQKVSRHAKLDTLQLYDDNRLRLQQEGTNLLSSLLDTS